MSNSHFARLPSIAIPRTKMKQSFTHSTSFNFGKIIPIDCMEVLPGDSLSLKLSSLIRMTQPIVPIMDSLDCDIHAFFVPLRLVYKHTQEFFGENKDSAGYQKGSFQIPQAEFGGQQDSTCVSTYLGKPLFSGSYYASCLKERAYWLIWSEWYRAQQVQAPFVMLDSDDEDLYIGHIGSKDILPSAECANVCKKFDYFTASTIAPQYGEEVLLPLGDSAPIVFYPGSDEQESIQRLYDHNGDEISDDSNLKIVSSDDYGFLSTNLNEPYPVQIDISKQHYVDLSEATASSVNQIRYAFQLQKYLERANFGSRYFEVLANHFGVTSPDARLQRPEYLGGQHFLINVQQVLSTAGATDDENTKLGQPGANSTTLHKDFLFSKAFVEHGFVMVMLSTRQGEHKYSQGILREDLRKDMFDYYFPEFANLGDQEIKNKEIMITGTNDDKTFGYQEHWAEYRYRPSRVSGMLNPNVANSEDYWTLANKFATRPTLSPQFIEENRDNLARALVNGSDASIINDFIADFYFDYTSVRPMPAYTIPGLIDHFGSR